MPNTDCDILIFSNSANGHYPEYIHHLYSALCSLPQQKVVIAVPEYFKEKKTLFSWPDADNISFDYLNNDDCSWGDGKWYKRNLRFAKLARKYIKKHNARRIFLLDPALYMPFIIFLTPSFCQISGIMYSIYLYRLQEFSFLRKLAEKFWTWLYAKSKKVCSIFVLNDQSAAREFNTIFHTDHFNYLPDPFIPFAPANENIRAKFNIAENKKILLHFGSMGLKKGTLEILKSILQISQSHQEQYCFIFAGCVQSSIKNETYALIEQINRTTRVQCLLFDEFCSYDFLATCLQACQVVLVPYLQAYNSSGCIGYAAQFNKPVIGPSYGLLGKLIQEYNLGLTLNKITPNALLQSYNGIDNLKIDGTRYLQDNTQEKFCNIIINKIKLN